MVNDITYNIENMALIETETQKEMRVAGELKERKRQSQELADAFLIINTPERISEQAFALMDIYKDPNTLPKDKIQAIKLLWDFSLAKPKQGVDVTSDGKSITGYSFEIVKPKDDTES